MPSPLAETFLINHRATLLLLKALDDEALAATLSTRGGRGVGHQFAHVEEVRRMQIEGADKKLAATLTKLSRDDGLDLSKLVPALERSAAAIVSLLDADDGDRLKGFKRGKTAFVGYLIAHEAHHRGHALLTLKQSGKKLPDAVKWGLWDWNKI